MEQEMWIMGEDCVHWGSQDTQRWSNQFCGQNTFSEAFNRQSAALGDDALKKNIFNCPQQLALPDVSTVLKQNISEKLNTLLLCWVKW